MKRIAKLWLGMAILVILVPLGLIIPEHFKAGSAWGEWGVEEIQRIAGYIPQGLAKLSPLWKAPIPDYNFKGWEEKGLLQSGLAYVFSAAVGILATIGFIYLLAKFLTKHEK